MQSAMQMFVARSASRNPLMQSVMRMFVARSALRNPCILPMLVPSMFLHLLLR